MAITWRDKILLAKIEASYGVDATPTGAANAILATNIELTPMEGSDVSRELERAFLGAQPTIPTELQAKISFSVELAPSGTAGTAPGWGVLLRACACAETISASTSVTYNPVSTGHESITIHMMIGNTIFAISGARGTAKFNLTAQSVPRIEFEFTGLFSQPAEGSRPTPDISGFQKPQLVTDANTTAFTINGTALVMRTAMLDLANAVEGRFLVGSEKVLITDRSDVIETTVEAVPLSTFDPFDLALDQTLAVVNMVHGTGAGSIATLNVPAAQMQRPQGLANAQNITEWPLRLIPQPVSGNDQWTLTLT